jgi:hypothetical protein
MFSLHRRKILHALAVAQRGTGEAGVEWRVVEFLRVSINRDPGEKE